MPRRASGEGSVFKLADGTWRAACPGGKPSFRGHTRAEAIRKREAHLRTSHTIVTPPRAARDSFAHLLGRWLDSRRKALAPRTVESYHATATRHIIPAIGYIPAWKLAADDIRRAMDSADSPRTQNYIRTVCHMALEFGVDNDLLPRNVARKVSPVRRPRTERDMPSSDEWESLLQAIEKEEPGTAALLLVLATCPLRVSEACGFRWGDYRDGHLYVVRAMDRHGDLVPVKTKAGRRIIPVGKAAARALDSWREVQAKKKQKHAKRWKTAAIPDLIFTTRYGTPWSQRNVLRAAHRVSKNAGLGKRSVHYLRHLAISHLVADPKMDMKTIQTIAGHSSIRVTYDTYGHLLPGRLRDVADAMDRRTGDDEV